MSAGRCQPADTHPAPAGVPSRDHPSGDSRSSLTGSPIRRQPDFPHGITHPAIAGRYPCRENGICQPDGVSRPIPIRRQPEFPSRDHPSGDSQSIPPRGKWNMSARRYPYGDSRSLHILMGIEYNDPFTFVCRKMKCQQRKLLHHMISI